MDNADKKNREQWRKLLGLDLYSQLKAFLLFPEPALENLATLLRPTYEPDHEKDLNTDQIPFYVAVTCALASQQKKKDLVYNERFDELLVNARRAIALYDLLGKDGGRHVDLMLFGCIIDIEQFTTRVRQAKVGDTKRERCKQMLDLLFSLSSSIDLINESYWEGETQGWGDNVFRSFVTDEEPPLGNVDCQLVQVAADCFQELQTLAQNVEKWQDVAACCKTLAEVLSGMEGTVRDSEGTLWPIQAYWRFAQGFAMSRLSAGDYSDLKKRDDEEHTERHMKELFFHGVWQQLPENARDALIQAEGAWWSRDRSTKSAVVDNFWKATVAMVRETLWLPFVEYMRATPRQELLMLQLAELQKKPAWEPSLSDFIQLMFQQACFDSFLRSQQASKDDKDFLSGISGPLRKLNTLRRKSVHPRKDEVVQPHDVSWAYRTFLGIDCVGILPFLAKLQLKR